MLEYNYCHYYYWNNNNNNNNIQKQWDNVQEMSKRSEWLSKEDFNFLMKLLDKAEEESNSEIVIDGNNKSEASLAVERITRIRLALIGLEKK